MKRYSVLFLIFLTFGFSVVQAIRKGFLENRSTALQKAMNALKLAEKNLTAASKRGGTIDIQKSIDNINNALVDAQIAENLTSTPETTSSSGQFHTWTGEEYASAYASAR